MTRTSDTFGALALAALTVFALWSSTLVVPLDVNMVPATLATVAAPLVA